MWSPRSNLKASNSALPIFSKDIAASFLHGLAVSCEASRIVVVLVAVVLVVAIIVVVVIVVVVVVVIVVVVVAVVHHHANFHGILLAEKSVKIFFVVESFVEII